MLGSIMFVLAMAWFFLAGGAQAGEEGIQPMRGDAPGGRAQVNQFQIRQDAWTGGLPANSVKAATAAKQRPDYVDWKDNCVRAPRMIAGQALEVESAGGYGLAQPYVSGRVEPRNDGFFELLGRELRDGDTASGRGE